MKRSALLCKFLGAALAVLVSAGAARADKLYLKDGRVLEGTVVSRGDGHIYFKYKVGAIEQTKLFSTSDYTRLETDSPDTPPAPAKPAPEKAAPATAPAPAPVAADAPAVKPRSGNAHRVAILNYGPPSSWSDKAGDMVGVQVSAKAFEDVVPMLEKDGVTDVVIRVNSGGGYSLEMKRISKMFEEKYKTKFHTVGWIESAISAAAMGPYILGEFYFMPEGNFGACTEFRGALEASKDQQLEEILYFMEEVSRKAGLNPFIMRAMQIQEPLSARIDEKGEVHWYQDDTSGEVVNPKDRVLTITAPDAVKFKFARGIASTKEELAALMFGENAEVEWVGKEAAEYMDNFIREADRAEKEALEVGIKYRIAIDLAQSAPDRQERGAQVGRARNFLNQLKKWVKLNPNFEFHLAGSVGALLTREWFQRQDELLRELMR
jgi:hypothetical protein